MPVTSPGATYTSEKLAINHGSHDPLLGLNNLVEQLIEFRKTIHLQVWSIFKKGYNSGTAEWKSCLGQGSEKGLRPPCPL